MKLTENSGVSTPIPDLSGQHSGNVTYVHLEDVRISTTVELSFQ
jgi:hypothetical protein